MIAFIALLYVTAVACSVNTPGPCNPKVSVIQNFDVAKYSGRWYETHRYDYANELSMDCVTATYTLNETGPVGVHNMGVFNNTMYTINGTAVLAEPAKKEGKLTVKFPNSVTPSPYWVLDTDYSKYAVVYSCTEKGSNNTVISWILSRTTVIEGASMEKINAVLTKNDVKWDSFRATAHTADACNGSSLPTLAVAVSIISALLSKFL